MVPFKLFPTMYKINLPVTRNGQVPACECYEMAKESKIYCFHWDNCLKRTNNKKNWWDLWEPLHRPPEKILIKHLAQCLASVNAQLKVTAGIIRGQWGSQRKCWVYLVFWRPGPPLTVTFGWRGQCHLWVHQLGTFIGFKFRTGFSGASTMNRHMWWYLALSGTVF